MASHQIDQREYADQDDIQRVPEQAPAQQAPQHSGSQALNEHLGHQIDERDQPAGDVNAVHWAAYVKRLSEGLRRAGMPEE